MWEKVYLALMMAMIGGTILSMSEVDAQPTVDDSASCESSTLDEATNLIRDYLKDIKTSFNALTQQQNNASSIFKKELEDLKAACVSNQEQSSTVNASSLCEYQRFRDFRT